jgi:hypothetical protein
MNPGNAMGWFAVGVTYVIVLASIFIFLGMMRKRRIRLERRRRELLRPNR